MWTWDLPGTKPICYQLSYPGYLPIAAHHNKNTTFIFRLFREMVWMPQGSLKELTKEDSKILDRPIWFQDLHFLDRPIWFQVLYFLDRPIWFQKIINVLEKLNKIIYQTGNKDLNSAEYYCNYLNIVWIQVTLKLYFIKFANYIYSAACSHRLYCNYNLQGIVWIL